MQPPANGDDRKVEVLQPSSLEQYSWPATDPHAISQRTRTSIAEIDLGLIKTCLHEGTVDIEAFLKYARQEKLNQNQTLLTLLSHRKFQMNSGIVRREAKWQECVESAMRRKAPIDIVYPQFCVIPNAPKRYTNTGSAAGEDCTIEFFKLINRQIQHLYPPGVRFHVLADAALYASAFQTHQTEVDSYFESVQNRINLLGASECVLLYDYSELLRTKCRAEYQRAYYSIAHDVWSGGPSTLLNVRDLETLRRSVRCSVNTRRFQLTHGDHLKLFGPAQFRDKDHAFHAHVETMTDIAFRELITIRLACAAVDISTKLWPNAIRATCHKGTKNGRWAIGLKPYPEYYGSCKLLPYHGMPVITRGSNGRPKLEISPEVLLRGREDLVRVTSDGCDEVWAYVAADIDKELLGQYEYARPVGMRRADFHGA